MNVVAMAVRKPDAGNVLDAYARIVAAVRMEAPESDVFRQVTRFIKTLGLYGASDTAIKQCWQAAHDLPFRDLLDEYWRLVDGMLDDLDVWVAENSRTVRVAVTAKPNQYELPAVVRRYLNG
jgi:hypothetical protein